MDGHTSSDWFWLERGGSALPVAWTGIEALARYGRARRRLRFGLCDPLVCNRMLLWGMLGALQIALSIVVLFQYVAYQKANVVTPGWDLIYGIFSIASVVAIWFAFFPPTFYRRWIGAGHNAATSENS